MPSNPLFNIVLYAPEIPGNTGSIGRTCLALNLRLILIKPYGFDLDEKAVRRAGLDYWKYVNITEYESWQDFVDGETPESDKLFFFSRSSETNFFQAKFTNDCFLIFGSESKGLPEHIFESYPENLLTLPMYSDKIRSLNLSNVATTVAYEAIRQLNFA